MFKRPNKHDTEENILKQEAEFLKAIGKDQKTTNNQTVGEEEAIQKAINPLPIGSIIERKFPLTEYAQETKLIDVPVLKVFHIDSNKQGNSSRKKSLFAQALNKKADQRAETNEELKLLTVVPVDNDLMEVHCENSAKMKCMSEEEIMTEKKSLEGMLSPEMLEFLKNRGSKKTPVSKNEEKYLDLAGKDAINIEDIQSKLSLTMSEEWMKMDQIEPEKLEWIGDIPDVKALEPDQPYSARFDFLGDLQPFKMEIDVRKSLYHHGEEPERAGYTIEELYQLARSTVLQQRIIALNVLANVIRKTKMGYYDECFDGALLPKLVASDVFFLLRFAMDDRAVIPAAVNCLNEFLCCRSDEICLDRLLNVTDNDIEPTLLVPFEIDNDSEEAELKDHQILAQDIIKGVVRTDILVRFNYILRNTDPDDVVKSKMLEVIIRICRHSHESCERVMNTPGLISYIFENLLSNDQTLFQCVKILRIIVSKSFDFAKALHSSYSFSFILKFIDMDGPAFKLKLECLALWKALVKMNLMVQDFSSFTPCLNRLLSFYIDNVDTAHGRFDFELFSAMVSLINVVQKRKFPIDSSYVPVIQKCLQKWIIQIQLNSKCNYSVAKAIGCALRFFTLKYCIHGVDNVDIDFLKKSGPLLATFLKSDIFQKLSKSLEVYSHLQKFKKVTRDPPNLPSLCAVYPGGSDYVLIVNDSSCLPLFSSLSNFLLKLFEISHKSVLLLEYFSSYIDTYVTKTLSCPVSTSWFNIYEAKLLASTAEIHSKLSNPYSLVYCFKCLPVFRSDDRDLLKIVATIFQNNVWPHNLFNLYSEQFQNQMKEAYLFDCKNVPSDWMYGPISKNPLEVLTFLATILQASPEALRGVHPTVRYYRLCLVLLDEDNIFNSEIYSHLEICFLDVIKNFDKLDLNLRVSENKSFYDLYRELVIQYAGTSYGNPLFAKFVTLPLAQKFDVSFRKLMWSEYVHALRVITLPENLTDFVPLDAFTSIVETDESLLVVYLNAISKNVLTQQRNGFIYNLAVENLRKYLCWSDKDERLYHFLLKKIANIPNCDLKNAILAGNNDF